MRIGRRKSVEEIVAQIKRDIDQWASENIIGKAASNEETLARYIVFAEAHLTKRLPDGYVGKLVNPHWEGTDIVADGVEVIFVG